MVTAAGLIDMRVSFPAIAAMTRDRFYEFCQANRDLRIERTAAIIRFQLVDGQDLVTPRHSFALTIGARNLRVILQFLSL